MEHQIAHENVEKSDGKGDSVEKMLAQAPSLGPSITSEMIRNENGAVIGSDRSSEGNLLKKEESTKDEINGLTDVETKESGGKVPNEEKKLNLANTNAAIPLLTRDDSTVRDEAALAIAALASTFASKPAMSATNDSHAARNTSVIPPSLSQASSSSSSSSSSLQIPSTLPNATAAPSKNSQNIRFGSPTPQTVVPEGTKSNIAPQLAQQQLPSTVNIPHQQFEQLQGPAIAGPFHHQPQIPQIPQIPMDAAYYTQFQQQQHQHQQQQQQQQRVLGPGEIPASGFMSSVWTPEEIMAVNQAHETLNQTALQYAQQAYQLRIQTGGNEFQAKDDARIAFEETIQHGQQMISMQVQALYQRRVQQALLQQRAMEAMRLTNELRGRAPPVASPIAPGALPSVLPTPAPSQPTPIPLAMVSPPPNNKPSSGDGQAFNFLCQAADDKPHAEQQSKEKQRLSPRSSLKQEKEKETAATVASAEVEQEEQVLPAVQKWRDRMIGAEIEVEYDNQWYPAKVVLADGDIFVVIYEEDETEERMRLFENNTAQDPEGDDEFRWRLRSSTSSASGRRGTRTSSKAAANTLNSNNNNNNSTSSNSNSGSSTNSVKKKKSGDDMEKAPAEESNDAKESNREAREKRAELRALANAKRLEEEALVNSKRVEEESSAYRTRVELELKAEREALKEERRIFEEEKKSFMQTEKHTLAEERIQLEEMRKANQVILARIEAEKEKLEELKKKTPQQEVEEVAEEEFAPKRKTSNSVSVNEATLAPSNRRGVKRKVSPSAPSVIEEDLEQNGAKTTTRATVKKVGKSEKRVLVEEEEEEEEEEISSNDRSEDGVEMNGHGDEDEVSDDENEASDEEDANDNEKHEESSSLRSDESKMGKKRRMTEPPSLMRWSTRKTMPVKRFQAGVRGKWSSGKAPRALGFIPKGKFGFNPPLGSKAMNWRVRVWWKDDRKFYPGTVDGFRNNKHKISYDDGDVEWLTLDHETIEWFIPDAVEFGPLGIDPDQAYGT